MESRFAYTMTEQDLFAHFAGDQTPAEFLDFSGFPTNPARAVAGYLPNVAGFAMLDAEVQVLVSARLALYLAKHVNDKPAR